MSVPLDASTANDEERPTEGFAGENGEFTSNDTTTPNSDVDLTDDGGGSETTDEDLQESIRETISEASDAAGSNGRRKNKTARKSVARANPRDSDGAPEQSDNSQNAPITEDGNLTDTAEQMLEANSDDGLMDAVMEQVDEIITSERPRKLLASKSTNVARANNTNEDRKPAARESPKRHHIKASKMVQLSQARQASLLNVDSDAGESPADVIILTSSDEERDEPQTGTQNDNLNDSTTAVATIPPTKTEEQNGARLRRSTPRDLPYHNEEPKKPSSTTVTASGNLGARDIDEGARVYCEFSENKVGTDEYYTSPST